MPILRTLRASFLLSILVASVVVVSNVRAAGHIGPERVSVVTGGAQFSADSFEQAVSSNGRIVAFAVESEEVNGFTNVYVRDRKSGVTTRISVTTDGAAIDGQSGRVSISANGRFVAFESAASNLIGSSLVAEDTNGVSDVFVHDRKTGKTRRVSVASDGAQGNGGSYMGVGCVSANGRFVPFYSQATNFDTRDSNAMADVYVHDRRSGKTTLASYGVGAGGNAESFEATVSDSGRFVCFSSGSSNLIAGDTNGHNDVFVRDLRTDKIVRASLNSSGGQTDGFSTGEPCISANGRFVAFRSDATTLVDGDLNGVDDIFVHDLRTKKTVRVSVTSSGAEATGGLSHRVAISADGKTLVFDSDATDLVPGDVNAVTDVFVHDMKKGTTRRISVDALGQEGNNQSISNAASLSANGKFIVYRSVATNLVVGDTNGAGDIFLVSVK